MTERDHLKSSAATLRILNLLLRHFAHGITNKDIASTLQLAPSLVTRHTQILEAEGFADRIAETGRLRASVRMAQAAVQIQQSLTDAVSRYTELQSRINTKH